VMTSTSPTFIVIGSPPNPNGDLHLGHLTGPFLGADVLARYLRQTGWDVIHTSYADDYSPYVARRAEELDRPAEEVAFAFGRQIEQTLSLAGMLPDYFTHPVRESIHGEVVQRFFRELWDAGAFEVQDLPVYWCDDCPRYLYEAELRGHCQFCGEPADGMFCEECGRLQDTTGLRNPRCTRCGSTDLATRTQARIVFPLEDYREQLRKHYDGRNLRPRLKAYLDEMLSQPLPPTPISRGSAYGVPVPLTGWEGHVLDTWYGIWGHMAAAEVYTTARGGGDFGLQAWRDTDTSVAHFMGFDCVFSHVLLWPATLMAHGGVAVPQYAITNEFYQLEGKKFSTSRGYAIWGGELLRRVPADLVRFYLCMTGPEQEQGSFEARHFTQTVNEQLVGSFQSWIRIVFEQVRDEWGGGVPDVPVATGTALADRATGLADRLATAFDPGIFSPRLAAAELMSVIEALPAATSDLTAARSGSSGASSAGDHPALLASHLELMATLAATAWPIMPAFCLGLWKALRLPLSDPIRQTVPWPESGRRLVPPGHTVNAQPPAPFQPVEL
jgi:methionyl-tRNA synthetase